MSSAIAGAIFFGVAGSQVGPQLTLVPVLVMVSALLALSVADIDRFRLPDRILFPSIAVNIAIIAGLAFAGDLGDFIVPAIVCAFGYFLFLLIPNLVRPDALAFGDVKLAFLLGLMLGWSRASIAEGLVLVVYALILGMLLGILSGIGVALGRRAWGHGFLPDPDFPPPEDGSHLPLLQTQFPFGPALALAAVIILFLGESIIDTPGVFSV
ncbi:MAG: prepilin peptidase [Acidimicrobiales bacterium]|nr:prepilin peptidase [Acidimicrobiales bacterium]RZV48723.1 MAG: prepilin peptidase [Acidimicrobiales bacterium]